MNPDQPRHANGRFGETAHAEATVVLTGDAVEDCSTCGGTGLIDWCPGQNRDSEEEQQPCPDCPNGELEAAAIGRITQRSVRAAAVAAAAKAKADDGPGWLDFDENFVLDYVNSSEFADKLAGVLVDLPRGRINYWVETMNARADEVNNGDWEDEDDLAGAWYDAMKSLSMDAIAENDWYRSGEWKSEMQLWREAIIEADVVAAQAIALAPEHAEAITAAGSNLNALAAAVAKSNPSDYALKRFVTLWGPGGRFAPPEHLDVPRPLIG